MVEPSARRPLLLDLESRPPLPSCPSTQDLCRDLARKGAPEGTCVLAREQTAGRGRGRRAWLSPAGAGLYLSFVLRPRIERALWPSLTAVVAVAAAEALEALAGRGWRIGIKWPNDLYGRHGKLGGILAEMQGEAVVIGLGINLSLHVAQVPPELRDRISSLELEGVDPAPDQIRAARAFNRFLSGRYAEFQEGRRGFLRKGLRARFLLSGARVVIGGSGRNLEGIAVDIGPLGELVIETPEGPRTVISGEVLSFELPAEGAFDAGPPIP